MALFIYVKYLQGIVYIPGILIIRMAWFIHVNYLHGIVYIC